MAQLTEKPIFVVGNPRSGTTLLRFILSSHPRIYIPDETGFIPFLQRDVEAELSLVDVQDILERIGRLNRAWDGIVDDILAFYKVLPGPRLAHVLDALYRQKIAEHGAVRWGDKTPSYVLYLPVLNKIFPTAQFVHLIRDGRDATLSAQKKWAARNWYMDNYYLIKNWTKCVERGREAGRVLGSDRYLEVHYEALVQHPKSALERICMFLGEGFCPEMLDHTRLARRQIGPSGHVEVREPVSTGSVQRWQTGMCEFDQKVADRVAGPTLSSLGYELAGLGSLSVGEQFRLLLLSVKYALSNTARQILTRWGLLTLNRGKRRRR
jgi:hypothetical protein